MAHGSEESDRDVGAGWQPRDVELPLAVGGAARLRHRVHLSHGLRPRLRHIHRLLALWSLGLACLDCYALKFKNDLHSVVLVEITRKHKVGTFLDITSKLIILLRGIGHRTTQGRRRPIEMRELAGSPGMWSSLSLRVGQLVFAAAFVCAIASALGFTIYTAFWCVSSCPRSPHPCLDVIPYE
uniref:CASP-like protein n=1 Tax=Oryza barthii TaxID=65489 RepID=A0A0D3GXR5_9ORYZ